MTNTANQHPCADPNYMFTFDPKILCGTSASVRVTTTDHAVKGTTTTPEEEE